MKASCSESFAFRTALHFTDTYIYLIINAVILRDRLIDECRIQRKYYITDFQFTHHFASTYGVSML